VLGTVAFQLLEYGWHRASDVVGGVLLVLAMVALAHLVLPDRRHGGILQRRGFGADSTLRRSGRGTARDGGRDRLLLAAAGERGVSGRVTGRLGGRRPVEPGAVRGGAVRGGAVRGQSVRGGSGFGADGLSGAGAGAGAVRRTGAFNRALLWGLVGVATLTIVGGAGFAAVLAIDPSAASTHNLLLATQIICVAATTSAVLVTLALQRTRFV
jgi:hypothetical protein